MLVVCRHPYFYGIPVAIIFAIGHLTYSYHTISYIIKVLPFLCPFSICETMVNHLLLAGSMHCWKKHKYNSLIQFVQHTFLQMSYIADFKYDENWFCRESFHCKALGTLSSNRQSAIFALKSMRFGPLGAIYIP